MLDQEEEHVFFWLRWEMSRLGLLLLAKPLGFDPKDLAGINEGVQIAFALETRRLDLVFALRVLLIGWPVGPALDERRVHVDQVLQRQADVDEVFDLAFTELIHVMTDPIAMIGGLVHHLAVGVAEPDIVLEEVAVRVDVGHDELLVHGGIGAHQVGVARVVVDNQFVDLGEAVAVAFGELFVFHPEPPVRVAVGEPSQRGDFVKLFAADELEDHVEEVPAQRSGHAPSISICIRRNLLGNGRAPAVAMALVLETSGMFAKEGGQALGARTTALMGCRLSRKPIPFGDYRQQTIISLSRVMP